MAPRSHLLLCLWLLHLPLLISAQSSNNIPLGSSLSTLDQNPYWTSPSGDFAFGFIHHQNLCLLAIWFCRIHLKTIVWTANSGVPVAKGARVELKSSGVLSLTSPNETQLWSVKAIGNSQITHAAMLDTGNFILSSTESIFAWASFDNPTDTMLPTQQLQLKTRLSSRASQTDYTPGRFIFAIQGDGNLVFYTMARSQNNFYGPYWASDTVGNGTQFVFNQSGYIYMTLKTGGRYYISPNIIPASTEDYYQRVTLDFDGVLRQYTYPKTIPSNGRWPSSWSTLWSLPADICELNFGEDGSGVCGFNSYCQMNQEQRPVCDCPPGYTYLNPKNLFGGCKQNFVPQSCEINGLNIAEGFEMKELQNTDWLPVSGYEHFEGVDEEWCNQTCLNDCFCAVAIVRDSDCWLKQFPLARGLMSPTVSAKALIKVGNFPGKQVPATVSLEMKWIILASVVLGLSIFFNLLILGMKKGTRMCGVNQSETSFYYDCHSFNRYISSIVTTED